MWSPPNASWRCITEETVLEVMLALEAGRDEDEYDSITYGDVHKGPNAKAFRGPHLKILPQTYGALRWRNERGEAVLRRGKPSSAACGPPCRWAGMCIPVANVVRVRVAKKRLPALDPRIKKSA